MPNPITRFIDSFGTDLGNKIITKEYLMTVYPQIAANMITPELWSWSYNYFGQLGNNSNTPGFSSGGICTPVTTSAGGANWKQVSGGGNHTAAIKTDGTLWTWGRNENGGQLGTNDLTTRSTPVTTFAGGTNWKQVSGGYYMTAAIKTDGTLWVWGMNFSGGLGINAVNNTFPYYEICTPVTTFAGGTNWKLVSSGSRSFHTAAIKTDGTLWVWGDNSYGQLGDNTTIYRSIPVTTFAGGTNWKQVAASSDHTAAIKTDGTLWTWGRNHFSQLGINNLTSPICTPVTTFAGGTNWKQVASGSTYSAAIKTDGTLWNWGRNNVGQLGDNTIIDRSIPVTTFAGGTNWKLVASGEYARAAIKTDGTLWSWGLGTSGQLGNNTATNRSAPVTTFAGGTNWKQVSCGNFHTVAIKTSDDLLGI